MAFKLKGDKQAVTDHGIPFVYGLDDGNKKLNLLQTIADSDLTRLPYNIVNDEGLGEAVAISRGVLYAGMKGYGNNDGSTRDGGAIMKFKHSIDSDGNGNGYLLPKFSHHSVYDDQPSGEAWTGTVDMGGNIVAGYGKVVATSQREAPNSGTTYFYVNLYDEDGNATRLVDHADTLGARGPEIAIGDEHIAVLINGLYPGTFDENYVKVFDLNGNEKYTLTATNVTNILHGVGGTGRFGNSVAIGHGLLVIGNPYHDELDPYSTGNDYYGMISAWDLKTGEFKWKRSGWQYINYTSDEMQLGWRVAVGCGIIAATAVGSVFSSKFGSSTAKPVYEDVITNGGTTAGAVIAFDLNGNPLWHAGGDGTSSSGTSFGDTGLAIGNGRIYVAEHPTSTSTNGGRVYVYDLNGNRIEKLIPSDDPGDGTHTGFEFGYSIDTAPGLVVIGNKGLRDNDRSNAKIYVYQAPSIYTPYDINNIEKGYK